MALGAKLPKEVIEQWPEVFEDITLNVLPFEYLNSINITFINNKNWEINLITERQKKSIDNIESDLRVIFNKFDNEIKKINFEINIEKIKKDVTKATNNFLRKKKLK